MRLPKDRVRSLSSGGTTIFDNPLTVSSILFYVVPSGVRTIGQPRVRLDMVWDDDTPTGLVKVFFAWGLYISTAADGSPALPEQTATDWLLWGSGLIANPYSYTPGGSPPTNETPFRQPSLSIEAESEAQRLVVPGHRLFLSWQLRDAIPADAGDGILYASVNFLTYGNAP